MVNESKVKQTIFEDYSARLGTCDTQMLTSSCLSVYSSIHFFTDLRCYIFIISNPLLQKLIRLNIVNRDVFTLSIALFSEISEVGCS